MATTLRCSSCEKVYSSRTALEALLENDGVCLACGETISVSDWGALLGPAREGRRKRPLSVAEKRAGKKKAASPPAEKEKDKEKEEGEDKDEDDDDDVLDEDELDEDEDEDEDEDDDVDSLDEEDDEEDEDDDDEFDFGDEDERD